MSKVRETREGLYRGGQVDVQGAVRRDFSEREPGASPGSREQGA